MGIAQEFSAELSGMLLEGYCVGSIDATERGMRVKLIIGKVELILERIEQRYFESWKSSQENAELRQRITAELLIKLRNEPELKALHRDDFLAELRVVVAGKKSTEIVEALKVFGLEQKPNGKPRSAT